MSDAPSNLDRIMTERNISNADLVKASTEQLTFKQVHKARLGKSITPNIQYKVINALNTVIGPKTEWYTVEQIFPI